MNEFYKSIKTFDDAYNYLLEDSFKTDEKIQDLLNSYLSCLSGSYEEKVAKLRIIVSTLNDNVSYNNIEHIYTPRFTFLSVDGVSFKTIQENYKERYIGVISVSNKKYYVLSFIDSKTSIIMMSEEHKCIYSSESFMTFLDCDIIDHFLKFFAKDIFEVIYGGITAIDFNWKWENL